MTSGMGGTIESQVNKGGTDLLQGYRGAYYLAVGLDGLGIFLATCLIISWRATQRAKSRQVTDKPSTQSDGKEEGVPG